MIETDMVTQCYRQTKRVITPVWATKEDFYELCLQGRLILDHFPDQVMKIMKGIDASEGRPSDLERRSFASVTVVEGGSSQRLLEDSPPHVLVDVSPGPLRLDEEEVVPEKLEEKGEVVDKEQQGKDNKKEGTDEEPKGTEEMVDGEEPHSDYLQIEGNDGGQSLV